MPTQRDEATMNDIPCDLCGLDVGNKPFLLPTPAGEKRFCCEGCRGIYQMLHQIEDPPAAPAPASTPRSTS
jgi:hypothetical protein